MDLFNNVDIQLQTPRRFDFEDFEGVVRAWETQKKLNTQNLVLLCSKHVSTEGFWIQPSNCVRANFDKLFTGKDVENLFEAIKKELELSNKTKRVFIIDYGTVSAAIITTNGLVTTTAPVLKWMMFQTLQQCKPRLKTYSNLKVQELDVVEYSKNNKLE